VSHGRDDLLRVLCPQGDRVGVNAGEFLEEHGFAFHDRNGGFRADVTRYLTEFAFDYYQVKMVCGPIGYANNRSIKGSEVGIKPTTKIIQGDWIWRGGPG
jgi:hypothetical protein